MSTLPPAEAVLAVNDVDVHYGGSRILRDVSLSITQGSIAAIMGRNGVGKTTLLKTIMGLVPSSKGQVLYANQDITRLAPDRREQELLARLVEQQSPCCGQERE